jgi:hypothetical protein
MVHTYVARSSLQGAETGSGVTFCMSFVLERQELTT